MTTHNVTRRAKRPRYVKCEKLRWQQAKGLIIARFGTISAAAAKLECHPNAVRLAIGGKCPDVAKRLLPLINP